MRPERHRRTSLSIHPYFGKVDPALARELISRFSKTGDLVLDPFAGSGTVLHESIVNGRATAGWDSSPLAKFLATAKLLGITDEEQSQLNTIKTDLLHFGSDAGMFRQSVPASSEIPSMPRVKDIRRWFGENALAELAYLKKYVNQKERVFLPTTSILLKTAFSRIVTAASNQQGESSYRCIEKADTPGRICALFVKSIEDVMSAAHGFSDLMLSRGVETKPNRLSSYGSDYSEIWWADQLIQITNTDTRTANAPHQTRKADLVVSSPPYLMSWDYGLYHKFRFYWLDFDLDAYEETEIGQHLRRKKDDVQRYSNDMNAAFHALSKYMTQEAYVVLINAPSVVYGKEVDTNAILGACGKNAGWKLTDCVSTIGIPGPHHGMYASLKTRNANAPGQSGKREHVLIFRRT